MGNCSLSTIGIGMMGTVGESLSVLVLQNAACWRGILILISTVQHNDIRCRR